MTRYIFGLVALFSTLTASSAIGQSSTQRANQALNQSVANNSQDGSGCNVGSNQTTRGNPNFNPYGQMQQQENQCLPGESVAVCTKRLYKIR